MLDSDADITIMDFDISFAGTSMCTPVYVEVDATEQLLLSERVCRKLGIIQYHPNVEPWRDGKQMNRPQLL